MNGILEIFIAGGFIMWPLLFCSLLSWAIFFERLWTQRNLSADNSDLTISVEKLLLAGQREKALEACIRSDLAVARIMEDSIRRGSDGADDLESIAKRIQRSRSELNLSYRRYLWILGTIGSATPFLGLFGTVVGIMRAFAKIGETGETGFAVVAAGISEALIATAAGIIVAVIALVFYNFLQVRAAGLANESKINLEVFIDSLAKAFRKTA